MLFACDAPYAMTSLSRALTSMTGLLSGTWTDHCLLAPHGAKQQEVRQVEQQMYGVSTTAISTSIKVLSRRNVLERDLTSFANLKIVVTKNAQFASTETTATDT